MPGTALSPSSICFLFLLVINNTSYYLPPPLLPPLGTPAAHLVCLFFVWANFDFDFLPGGGGCTKKLIKIIIK
jgi:hypothetical protein